VLAQSVEAEITDAMGKLPNGPTLLALMAERAELAAKLQASSPLFDYLKERRRWWDNYPDYVNTLNRGTPLVPAPGR
jgi:hypothetical protein